MPAPDINNYLVPTLLSAKAHSLTLKYKSNLILILIMKLHIKEPPKYQLSSIWISGEAGNMSQKNDLSKFFCTKLLDWGSPQSEGYHAVELMIFLG